MLLNILIYGSRIASRNSSVGIETDLWFGRPRGRGPIPSRARDLNFFQSIQIDSGTHQASCSVTTGGCFPRREAAGAWNWKIMASSAEVKNEWRCTSTPLYDFMVSTGTNVCPYYIAYSNIFQEALGLWIYDFSQITFSVIDRWISHIFWNLKMTTYILFHRLLFTISLKL